MLEVQKYLKEKGLDSLVKEFNIKVNDYPDIVVLNYCQISSPKFNPICDGCRSLILEKNTWKVLSYPFQRFYNAGEGVNDCESSPLKKMFPNLYPVRIASYSNLNLKSYQIKNAIIEHKIDGSIVTLWFFNGKWNVSTRSMAYAEGQTNMGRTFAQVFEDAVRKTDFYKTLENDHLLRDYCFTFELTSAENRVVTPFTDPNITLIGARYLKEESNYRELSRTELSHLAQVFKVDRPKTYKASSYEELVELVNSFHCLQEGVVLVWEVENGSHIRLKCKNVSYLAIAHMRNNGAISPKRILTLIMENEQSEYRNYFPEDSKYIDFVELEYVQSKERIKSIYRDNMNLVSQKDFALAIMPKTVYKFEQGVVFTMRKNGGTVEEILKEIGPDRIAKGMNLRDLFVKKFGVSIEEEEV